jgi:hypothetical protein
VRRSRKPAGELLASGVERRRAAKPEARGISAHGHAVRSSHIY